MKAKGLYSVQKWKERTYEKISSDMKMTRASVEYKFSGDLEGKALVEYLMFYNNVDVKDQHKSSATYLGLLRFAGKLAGRPGSFVMTDEGIFKSGSANSCLRIQEGSGTELLKGITGTGTYQANNDGSHIELEYEVA